MPSTRSPSADIHPYVPGPFRWGLIGPGGIARRFVEAVQAMPGARVAAVLGRNRERAAAFVDAAFAPALHERPQIPPSLEAMLGEGEIDAVYIATPHDSHGQLARACLSRGVPVLCEKPLTPSGAETQALVDAARAQRVFLMEALWTVFLPVYGDVAAWLRAGRIGALSSLASSFCFEAPYRADSRLFSLDRAGGCLLDIGIYNMAVTRCVLQAAMGRCPEPQSLQATGRCAASGADAHVEGALHFPGNVVSRFICSFEQSADNTFRIIGTRGEITIEAGFWAAVRATLTTADGLTCIAEQPWRTNGFEYEIEEAMRCIREGRLESPVMPHAESLALVGWLDVLRRQLGVRYPFER